MTLPATNPNLVPGHEIKVSDIEIQTGETNTKAYIAQPSAAGSRPGVIVIHENRGLVPYIRDVADALASSGYVAVAPDLLSREGGTASVPDVPPVLSEIPLERHVGDLQRVAHYLQSQPGVSRIGVMGFCFGGAVTWLFATANKDISAAVPFYGSNPPIEAVPNISAAVFAVYGELDERINQGIPAITEALNSTDITHDMKVYPKAQHAFHNHTNAERYEAKAASDAWADALKWLDLHLQK